MYLMVKVFKPADIEDKGYKHWMEKGYFHAEVNPGKRHPKRCPCPDAEA